MATYSRPLPGSLNVAKPTAFRPHPSSTTVQSPAPFPVTATPRLTAPQVPVPGRRRVRSLPAVACRAPDHHAVKRPIRRVHREAAPHLGGESASGGTLVIGVCGAVKVHHLSFLSSQCPSQQCRQTAGEKACALTERRAVSMGAVQVTQPISAEFSGACGPHRQYFRPGGPGGRNCGRPAWPGR